MEISRVCEVNLHGDHTFALRQQKYKVSEALKTGEATALFGSRLYHFHAPFTQPIFSSDYLADSVDAFLTSASPTDPAFQHDFGMFMFV
jgi:hexokinase